MTSHLSVGLALASMLVVVVARVGPSVRARASGPPRQRSPVVPRAATASGRVVRAPLLASRATRGRLEPGARWAAHADLAVLFVDAGTAGAGSGPPKGRLVLGEPEPRSLRRRLLAAEAAQSLAVIGPTQSGKTTALAVPAILGWDGPVLAASVKTDLVRDTLSWRAARGQVWCFDPAGTTGLPQSGWSPVTAARTWAMARRVAADLTDVARSDGTSADGEFWYATAAKLLAPLLFAAAAGGRTIHDVVRWVDTQETEEVSDILYEAGVPEAMQAARATWLRDERQRSSIYTTAETVLEAFAEPQLVVATPTDAPYGDPLDSDRFSVRQSDTWQPEATPPYGVRRVAPEPRSIPGLGAHAGSSAWPQPIGEIDPEQLLSGANTLYVCAPAHDQRRLRALFVALVQQVVHAAFARAARAGKPLDPPLLVVLDEAANIAPLRELDGLAATCAGHGVQLVTVWQDLAQVRARYGERAATVVNNHRAKLFLPGIADPGTLDFASQLAGDEERTAPSVTVGARGQRTVTTSAQVRRLLPADTLRRLPPGRGVLLYGSLPPAKVKLRPWYEDPVLAARAGTFGTAHT